jgi:hypothetical protein
VPEKVRDDRLDRVEKDVFQRIKGEETFFIQ